MDRALLLRDLHDAVERLAGALSRGTDDDLVKAGCIQYFEFSLELAWKTIKCLAEEQGITDCISPKAAFKYAFRSGWLPEEDVWLAMLSARNRMSHTYSAPDALVIYEQLPRFHIALRQLANRLDAEA